MGPLAPGSLTPCWTLKGGWRRPLPHLGQALAGTIWTLHSSLLTVDCPARLILRTMPISSLWESGHTLYGEGGCPVKTMHRMIEHAKEELQHAKSPWSKVYGPAATIVMTCRRLRCTVLSATHFVTDNGHLLNLVLDPPAVVLKLCTASVQRWRWRRIEKVLPQLAANGSGRGAFMEPIWHVLHSKACAGRWDRQQKGQRQVRLCWSSVSTNAGEGVWLVHPRPMPSLLAQNFREREEAHVRQ